jgi:malonyl CoA-acyl carrier protein transacylase
MKLMLFPGQGSQRKGFGAEILQEDPQRLSQMNSILGFDLLEVVGDDEKLQNTRYAQCLIFALNALQTNTFFGKGAGAKNGWIFAGHSLGEYNALYAAEAVDFFEVLTLIKRRSELMSEAKEGAMAAITGINSSVIMTKIMEAGLREIYIANFNSDSQVVVSGRADAVDKLSAILGRASEKPVIRLKVSGAFHTPLMKEANVKYAELVSALDLKKPTRPIISSVDGKKHEDAEDIRKLLKKQMTSPVKWVDVMKTAREIGVEELHEFNTSILKNLAG